ncbi:MAG: right-handed parallel beta-helix repeat-containing protein [Clostridia bacterium]|nr:right-handed parallel beta-helix repeat-containing protein [Clostridia bacterium]
MKSKKLISALLLLAVAGSAASAVTLAACKDKVEEGVIYVSVDGKANGSGSKKKPKDLFSTLRDVDHTIDPGTTILVQPGTYVLTERINVMVSGEYNKYITIKNADPTKKAVLSFYGMGFGSTERGVQVYGDYIHWDGIDICGAGDNGMYIGGNYNIIENSEFYDNRDTGLQLGRSYSPTGDQYAEYADINYWPSYNLIKNCTSYNNYDNETYGENADGFAAKLTVGYGNVFDGCIAYRNSDDGWDLYAKSDSGNIGQVIMYNCVAFDNGFILETQESFNSKFPAFNVAKKENDTNKYTTRDGDGNGFKLGGSVMEGEVYMQNCLSFHNRMHGVTDNSNPGVIVIDGITSYNNGANVDAEGKIAYTSNGIDDGCGNIDLARQFYSYNHVANTLSVNNGQGYIAADEYRGTVSNSTFVNAGTSRIGSTDEELQAYKGFSVTVDEEYNTKTKDRGTRNETATAAEDIFKALPTTDLGFDKELHAKWRNADGSVNLGDLLALKDANGTQGSKLNYSGWDEYPHYGMHDLTTMSSKDEAVAQAIIDMAYLPVNTSGVYQDFDAVTKIKNVEIKWTSSDESLIKVTSVTGSSNSKHEDVRIEVIRPADGDKQATLTATVVVGEVTKTKSFTVTVKKNTYRIGEIYVEGLEGDAMIKDKGATWDEFQPPVAKIINGTSDSGVVIDKSLYGSDVTVRYATFNAPESFTVKPYGFDATQAGIWEIEQIITLDEDKVELGKSSDGEGKAPAVGTKVYYIYVADPAARNSFRGNPSVTVNHNGYNIQGNFSSPTGYIYSMSVPEGGATPTADEIKAAANDETNTSATKYGFRATGGSFDFANDNSAGYTAYYFLESVDGTQKSRVYKQAIATKNISTKAEFEGMLASNNNTTIYLLQNDIDLEGSVATTDVPFKGVFNGMGHKIHNAEIKKTVEDDKVRTGLFRLVQGGSIMNVTFENIVIEDTLGKAERTGIVATMRGGYLGNIVVHNCDVTGIARVGALVGQILTEASDGHNTTIIDRISVTSDKDASGNYLHKVYATNQRVGAVVGYIQAGNAAYYNVVYISNCFVDTYIKADASYCGGVLGRCDDRNANDYLEITNCLFVGKLESDLHVGGIVGGISGTGKSRIFSCVGYGTMIYTSEKTLMESSAKNCSNIVGNCGSNADAIVRNCYAKFDEFNANFNVTTFGAYDDNTETYAPQITQKDFWLDEMTSYSTSLLQYCSSKWDFENVWELVLDEESGSAVVKSPYVKLIHTLPSQDAE